ATSYTSSQSFLWPISPVTQLPQQPPRFPSQSAAQPPQSAAQPSQQTAPLRPAPLLVYTRRSAAQQMDQDTDQMVFLFTVAGQLPS
ncbi:hypothetical protein U1Q18_009495, partial [Sarracenia purpurea var. burkii]